MLNHEIQKQIRADIIGRGRAEHGEQPVVFDGLPQAFFDVIDGQRAFVEKLFEQRIVAFSDRFDECLVSRRVGKERRGEVQSAVVGLWGSHA